MSTHNARYKFTAGAIALTAAVALSGCTGGTVRDNENDATSPVEPTQSSESSAMPSDGATGGATDGSGDAGANGEISKDEAARIVTDKYGGTVKSVEDDHHQGEPTWEVEVRDSNEGRIEVEVSKKTGEIVKFEHDD